jgi:hypothetical protein
MRTLCRMVLALGVLALVVYLAPAQQQRQRGGGRGGFGRGGLSGLLNMKEVQQELKLSDEQVDKAKKVAQDVQMKHQEDFQKLQDVPREDRFAKMAEIQGQVRDETIKDLSDVLKPDQIKRLKQLVIQQQANSPFGGGPRVFLSPDVEKKLKLTDKQKDDLKTIADDYQKDVREMFQGGGGFNAENRKKMEEMRKDVMTKATEQLDAKQKKQWEEMTGAPFKFPAPMRRGGGGGGGR